MNYWIDVESGEYGLVENSESLPGLVVSGRALEGGFRAEETASRAREVGGVLVMEEMETFRAVFGALESALAMSFIYSPVAPACADSQPTRLATQAMRVLASPHSAMEMAA